MQLAHRMNIMYSWLPTSCAPINFPIRIIVGTVVTLDSQVISIPEKAYLDNGWGEPGEINLIGADENYLPDRLIIRWFSFRERKFYEIDHKLPVQKIDNLFRQGFLNQVTGKQDTYEYIIFGMAPSANVSIWVNGHGFTTEVTCIKANEIQVNTKLFIGSATDLETYVYMTLVRKFTQKEIVSIDQKTDLTKWSSIYTNLFDWKLNIVTSALPKYIILNFYNGEAKFWLHSAHRTNTNGQPIPKTVTITYENIHANISVNEVSFNEAEIFAAFFKLASNRSPIMLQLEINTAINSIEIYLLNDKNAIKLKNCIIEIY